LDHCRADGSGRVRRFRLDIPGRAARRIQVNVIFQTSGLTMKIVNWNVMRHPLNWVTIWLMLFIAGIALHFIMVWLGKGQPPKPAGYGSTPRQTTGRPPGFSEPMATTVEAG
jgi:hypothetical protein